MKQRRMILLSLFLCGILLTGIGVGVSFWEFESFEYKGTASLGEEDLKTEIMKYELPVGKDEKKIAICHSCDYDKVTYVEDESLSNGTVQFELTYNKENVEPYVMYEEHKEDPTYKGTLYLGCHSLKDEVELFFENKTQILLDLKERKISSYELSAWDKIIVKANPKTMKYLEF